MAPIEVEAALQYATNYVPWLTHVASGVPVLSAGGYIVAVRLSYTMGKNRTAPRVLATLNDHGVPWTSLILAFVVGLMIFFLPFPGWQKLVGFITSATVLSFGSGPLVFGAMRRELPGQERPFRLGGGDVIPLLAFWSSNLIVYWTGWSTNSKLFLAIMLGLILLAVQQLSPERRFELDWKAGSWIWPWLIGLAVISYLGSYGDGTGAIGFGDGAIWTAVLSLVVYVWAIRGRFIGAKMADTIAHEEFTAPETRYQLHPP